jgi:CRISPR/Cas system Type II protein with McrA/HNH and RuvC-like nuclease domain
MANKRDRIIKKYDGICQICLEPTDLKDFKKYPEIDHIVPRSIGGDGSDSNSSLVCNDCNNKKGHTSGEKHLLAIKQKLSNSMTLFDKQLLAYEIKNRSVSHEEVSYLIRELEEEFQNIKYTLLEAVMKNG